MRQVRYRYAAVDGLDLFYREAGLPENPTILLLHGFPSSSIQFRHMLAELSDRWHLVAPDLPGFGFTRADGARRTFTFAGLAAAVRGLIEKLHLDVSAAYLHDYGGQAGFRLLTDGAIRPRALVIQNTEAYRGVGWHDLMWTIEQRLNDPPEEARSALVEHLLNRDGIRKEFLESLPSEIVERFDPAVIELGWNRMNDGGNLDAMVDLHLDYGSNLQHYPKIQAHLRSAQTPTLVLWGERDQYVSPEGAHAYKRDLPDLELILLDGGHWLLESHVEDVNAAVRSFLSKHLPS